MFRPRFNPTSILAVAALTCAKVWRALVRVATPKEPGIAGPLRFAADRPLTPVVFVNPIPDPGRHVGTSRAARRRRWQATNDLARYRNQPAISWTQFNSQPA